MIGISEEDFKMGMYIDDFVPGDETDIDRNKELRAFMQEYFRSRNLHV